MANKHAESPLEESVVQPETVISYQEAPLEETVEQPETVISYEDVVSMNVLLISLKIASNFIKKLLYFHRWQISMQNHHWKKL